ncbi:ATP phosphoribosyltransferase [Synechococcus sp. PCC 7336]|uniref:ATP phosphoribosyltransferase n=1 Tax=Synechococcus sp. PCC 7336 TaxID=195250 RepID=UPI00034557DC|nr:ATP phosphoribosyltransferase [Synechococcus sp. PCC 7336]
MTVTVALAKGELLAGGIALFQRVGIDFSQLLDKSNRLLRVTSPISPDGNRYEALLVRTHDVPVYVEYGQAQLGVAGYDVLREKRARVAQLADLKFGGCRMSVAVKQDSSYTSARDLPPNARIASKFVNCAADYFEGLDLPVEIIPLYGSVELAPLTGMAEAIVDLVATGRTLRENGLVELECIYESTARLVAHPISYRVNRGNLAALVARIRDSAIESSYSSLR